MSDKLPAEHIEDLYEDAQQSTDDADAVFSILSGILSLHHQSDKVANLLSCLQQKIKNQYILSVFTQAFAPFKEKVKIDTLFFHYAYDLSFTNITNWQEATNNFTPSEIRRFIESGQNDMERKEILNAIYLDYESKKASIHLPQVDFSQFRSAIAETNLKERITELTAENQRLNSTIHALNQDQDDNGTISISSFIKASKSLSTHDAHPADIYIKIHNITNISVLIKIYSPAQIIYSFKSQPIELANSIKHSSVPGYKWKNRIQGSVESFQFFLRITAFL